MARGYALRIEAIHNDDQRICMSKGHHDLHAFMCAVREYGETGWLRAPTHEWVKCVPAHPATGYTCFYHLVDKGVRGAFPATYTYVDG